MSDGAHAADRPGRSSTAIEGARFGHVNVIAKDWRALAAFYRTLFGCVDVPPERDFSGPDLEALTGIAGARLRGAHLRLPGLGDAGPTIEIYQYDRMPPRSPTAVDRPGFAHIAFAVDDVVAAREAVLAAGGGAIGEIATLATADGRRVIVAYMTDPEGNAVELQSWS